jgi:hypothetical protein
MNLGLESLRVFDSLLYYFSQGEIVLHKNYPFAKHSCNSNHIGFGQ